MSRIEKFEDLIAWQKARVLTREIYALTRGGAFGRDYALAGQIQRAAVSIMSNIAEGFERSGLGEFHQFLSIAKASCAEVRSQLYVALDAGYLDQDAFEALKTKLRKLGGSSVVYGWLSLTVEMASPKSKPLTLSPLCLSTHYSAL